MKQPPIIVKNSGFTLIELLIVILIFSTIAAFAVPKLNGTLSTKDLDNAAITVAQALNKAKVIARSESTSVEIDFAGNIMSIKKLNTSSTQKITLSKRVSISSSSSPFTLNTQGSVVDATSNTEIKLTYTTGSDSRVITVSPFGRVAS